jgi:hypothetical protein
MSGRRHNGWIGGLLAMIAVLLPAGVLAAATVGSGVPPNPDRRVAAAALGQESLAADDTVGPRVTTTAAPLPPAPATTSGRGAEHPRDDQAEARRPDHHHDHESPSRRAAAPAGARSEREPA